MMQLLWLIPLGYAVGTFGTLIGAGGGFILVPILLLLYPDKSPETITSISLAVVFFNALSGSIAYFKMERIDYKSGLIFAVATIPGAILGSMTVSYIPRNLFNAVFGIIMIILSIFLLTSSKESEKSLNSSGKITRCIIDKEGIKHVYSYNPIIGVLLSIVVGYVSSLLGIGGGIIHVPALIHLLNFPVHIATATSHFILTVMALTGTVVHIFDGTISSGIFIIAGLAIGVIFGAQLGAKLSKYIKSGFIIKSLAIALGLVGVRIFLMAFSDNNIITNTINGLHPITFPGLGLKFIIDPIAIQLFGISIHWYGIIIGLGCALALYLANRDAKRFSINSDDITDFILFALPLSIIGARIYYVVFSWNDYKDNIFEVFQIWHGGIAIYGGVLTAVIVALVFTKKRKIDRLEFFDFLIPYLALGQSIGRWGNFVNQEAHGVLTKLPWRMEILDSISGQRIAVHPTFLYESLWSLGLFLYLIWFRNKKRINGEVFTLYLAFYGLARFYIEGLRTDSLFWGSIRVSQVLAGLFFVVSITIFVFNRVRLSKINGSEI